MEMKPSKPADTLRLICKLKDFQGFYIKDIDISSVVEFQRWWVLKSKILGQESTYSKDFFSKSVDESWFIKKCQNCTFKVNFRCQKSTDFFQKKT